MPSLRAQEAPAERIAETMMRAAGLVLVLALLGCAKDWKHPTKTQDDYHKDYYDCRRDTARASLDPIDGASFHDACLRARGWRD